MRNRGGRRQDRGGWFAEGLEARDLPTAGLAGLIRAVEELGPITRSAATAGVAATATIEAGHAVTFRFEVEAAGDYTLLVQHTGAGLTLDGTGPTGSFTVRPVMAGTGQAIPLRMPVGTYEVTASADGGESVFVDWELLLNNGVGQSTAAPAVSVLPALGPVGAAAAPPPGGIGPGDHAAAAAPIAAVAALPPLGQGIDRSSFAAMAGGLVGRPTPEPPSPAPATMVAAAAPAVGVAPTPLLAGQDIDAALMAVLQSGIVTVPAESPASNTWIDLDALTRPATRELDPMAIAAALPDDLDPAAEPASDAPAGERISLLAVSPGLLCGAVAITVASRGRLKGKPALVFHRGSSAPAGKGPNRSMDTLRAFLKRS